MFCDEENRKQVLLLGDLSDPLVDAGPGFDVPGQEEDHFLQRSRSCWEKEGAWTLRVHVLCGRSSWSEIARNGENWSAPCFLGEDDEVVSLLKNGPPNEACSPSATAGTPHTRAMRSSHSPCVRTHDYPSDFLEKWTEAACSGSVADKLPPHAMPVSGAQMRRALDKLATVFPLQRRQITAVPAWDGRRIVGYALLHALPPPSLLSSRNNSLPAVPRLSLGESASEARDPLELKAKKLKTALKLAGASRTALDDAFLTHAPDRRRTSHAAATTTGSEEEEATSTAAKKKKCSCQATARRARIAARRCCATPTDLALFEAGLRAPLEALVSTLYLASVKDQNPLHAVELIASAACHGKRTLLPWSGEWADPTKVGTGADDDPCEKLAASMGLDILDVAGAVHRGREFVEPVLELGLSSGQNGLFRALAIFGTEVIRQCSRLAENGTSEDAAKESLRNGTSGRAASAAVKKLSRLLASSTRNTSSSRPDRNDEGEDDRRETPLEESLSSLRMPPRLFRQNRNFRGASITRNARSVNANQGRWREQDNSDAAESAPAPANAPWAGYLTRARIAAQQRTAAADAAAAAARDQEGDAPVEATPSIVRTSEAQPPSSSSSSQAQQNDENALSALAESLLARALVGRDKYAPKALMRAAATATAVLASRGVPLPPEPLLAGYAARLATTAAQRDVEGVRRSLASDPSKRGGQVVPVVLVLAFEESVYVILEAHRSELDKLCSATDEHRVFITGETWTGAGFGHAEVMMQLPQPLRLACDRGLLQQAVHALEDEGWLTLALLPGADDLVAVPIAGFYARTAAAAGFAGGPFNTRPSSESSPSSTSSATPTLDLPIALVGEAVLGSLLDRDDDDDDEDEDDDVEEDHFDEDDAEDEDDKGDDNLEEADDDDQDDEEELFEGVLGSQLTATEEEEEKSVTRKDEVDEEEAATTRCEDDEEDEGDDLDEKVEEEEPDAAPSLRRAMAETQVSYLSAVERIGDQYARSAQVTREQSRQGPPASPGSLLLASYFGYRDGLAHNGPPVDCFEGKTDIRPSIELLKALCDSPQPHVKLASRVVSVSSIRTAVSDALQHDAARFAIVRCPVKLESSRYYQLPHVHSLVTTRHKRIPQDNNKKRKPTDDLEKKVL